MERNKYKNKKNDKGNGNSGSGDGINSRSNRYSSRSQQPPAESNNIESSPRNNKSDSDSDDNYAITEELYVLTEEDIDQGVKEAVAVVKQFDTSDNPQNKSSVQVKGIDIRVLITAQNSSRAKKQSTVLGLLDSGATNNFISKETLKYVDHTTTPTNSCVNGRYSRTDIRQKATFDRRSGRHNIVFGTPFHLDYLYSSKISSLPGVHQ